MKQKVSIFDIGGTLTTGFYIVNFPEMLYKEGNFSETELNAIREIFRKYEKGITYPYEQFAWDLVNAFGRGIKGQQKEVVEKMGEKFIHLHPEEKFSFTDRLVRMVKDKGYRTVVISGSPYEIVYPFSRSLGIDEIFATTYKIDNGIFIGEVLRNCAVNETKRQIIQKYFQENDIDSELSAGFGNSHHDLAFLELVGYPVAVMPNQNLEIIAQKNGWLICKDKNKVLESIKIYLP